MFSALHFCKLSRYSLNKQLIMSGVLLPSSKVDYSSMDQSSAVHKSHSPNLVLSRTFWETFPHFRPITHIKDQLSREEYNLIYRAKVFNYAFYSQFFCLNVIAAQVLGGLYYIYKTFYLNESAGLLSQVGGYALNYNWGTVAILAVLSLQNLAIFIVARRMVLRIYFKKDTDEYVLVTLGKNPFNSKLVYCKPGELTYSNLNNVMEIFGNHKLKGKKLFIRDGYFKTMDYYNNLLGKVTF